MAKLSLVARLIRLPLKLIPKDLTVRFLYGPLTGFSWITGASNHGYWLGFYERKMKSLLTHKVSKGDVFLDLGAHVGYYSLLASRLTGPQGKVYSFEPLPRNIAFLKKHFEMNGITNVVLYEGAVAHFDGHFNLSSASPVGAKLSEKGNLRVRVYSLKNLIDSGEIPVPQVMKIDIEGAEQDMLADIKSMLNEHRPKLFLSTHGKSVHQYCLALMRELEYSMVPLDGETLESCTEFFCERVK